ncbi:hypothetical protein STEG23_018774, partial [Scotinomys teguina]
GQPALQSKFQDSQSYAEKEKPCLEKPKRKRKRRKEEEKEKEEEEEAEKEKEEEVEAEEKKKKEEGEGGGGRGKEGGKEEEEEEEDSLHWEPWTCYLEFVASSEVPNHAVYSLDKWQKQWRLAWLHVVSLLYILFLVVKVEEDFRDAILAFELIRTFFGKLILPVRKCKM